MIKRIELANFMSHEHTVIEPADGLTVLVGPNNCGKSAVVAALQILAYNDNSKYVVRHGQRECSVRVETDDGHVIQWRRKRDSPSYTIDGQLYDRLGRGGTPDELDKALRLPKVVTGDRETDVHFGEQKHPIFLLDSSELQAAQFFASSSDASRFVEMQTLHKQKAAAAQRDKCRLETEAAQLNRELESLEPTTEIDDRLRELEQAYAELRDLAECIDQHSQDVAQLRARMQRMARHGAETQALAALPTPPEMLPLGPLVELIQQLQRVQRLADRSAARGSLEALAGAPELALVDPLDALLQRLGIAGSAQREAQAIKASLEQLSGPPVMHDLADMQRTVQRILEYQQDSQRWGQEQSVLAPSSSPPQLAVAEAAAGSLQQLIGTLKSASDRAAACDALRGNAQANLRATEDRISQWAAQEQVCPTCGGVIDADRLMERITALEGACLHE